MHISQTMNVQVYEILEHVNTLAKTNRAEAVTFLQNNRSRVVIEGYLKMNYDPSIVFQLPPGVPPFKKDTTVPDGYSMTDLKQEFRRMRVFTDQALNITKMRREQLWLQMCEGLYWKEADLINKIKDRRLTDLYDALTEELVRIAYPGLLPEVVAQPVPEELLAPVDYGDNPADISEEELIKAAIAEEEAKNQLAGLAPATQQAPAPRKRGRPRKTVQPVEATQSKQKSEKKAKS